MGWVGDFFYQQHCGHDAADCARAPAGLGRCTGLSGLLFTPAAHAALQYEPDEAERQDDRGDVQESGAEREQDAPTITAKPISGATIP